MVPDTISPFPFPNDIMYSVIEASTIIWVGIAGILLYVGLRTLLDKNFVKKIGGNFVTQYVMSFKLIAAGVVVLLLLYALFFEIP